MDKGAALIKFGAPVDWLPSLSLAGPAELAQTHHFCLYRARDLWRFRSLHQIVSRDFWNYGGKISLAPTRGERERCAESAYQEVLAGPGYQAPYIIFKISS